MVLLLEVILHLGSHLIRKCKANSQKFAVIDQYPASPQPEPIFPTRKRTFRLAHHNSFFDRGLTVYHKTGLIIINNRRVQEEKRSIKKCHTL
jgi:hypothetical protein